ncbi:hypothetical protein L9F63_027267, partial [Diploptera punctata]
DIKISRILITHSIKNHESIQKSHKYIKETLKYCRTLLKMSRRHKICAERGDKLQLHFKVNPIRNIHKARILIKLILIKNHELLLSLLKCQERQYKNIVEHRIEIPIINITKARDITNICRQFDINLHSIQNMKKKRQTQ